jgi:imidazole glycerol-phosphate synthase subunit HisH
LRNALENNVRQKGKPLLGICVGMQILAESSEEGKTGGLGWIPGRVLRIDPALDKLRLPHMGWNSVIVRNDPLRLFRGVNVEMGFYFLHNYYFKPASEGSVEAEVEYGGKFACAISNAQNIMGVQFHPEKSHSNGMKIFKNFAGL